MKQWSHFHSIAVGGLLTLALATHLWTLLVLVFAAGVLVGRFWNLLHWTGEALRDRMLHARRERFKPVLVKPVDEDGVPW